MLPGFDDGQRNTNNQGTIEDNTNFGLPEDTDTCAMDDANNFGAVKDNVGHVLAEENNYGTADEIVSACDEDIDVSATVATLRQDMLDIENYFEDIRRSLNRLNEIQKQRALVVIPLFSTSTAQRSIDVWDGIRRGFKKLVWKSRELATTVATRAKQFRTDLIPLLNDSTVDLADKKKELAEFLKDLKKTEKLALEMTDGFRSIPERIIDFQSIFRPTIEKDQTGIDKGIQQLNGQIEILKSKIRKYKEEHTQAWSALHSGILREGDVPIGYDALVAMETLAGPGYREPLIPKVLRGVKTKTIMIRTRVKMSRADNLLREKQAKLGTMKADAESLKHWIAGYVEITETRTGVTCDKIKAIALVWAAVRTDAQTLHESMASPIKPFVSEQRFRALVSETLGIVPLYEKLEKILIGYANDIV